MNNYNYLGNKYLPRYSFGSWLKENAGTIGSTTGAVVGGAVGSLILPGIGTAAGASLGASLGGQAGGAVQQNYEEDQAMDSQKQQMANLQKQQLYQNRLNMASQGLQNRGQNQFAGTQSFKDGGNLPNVNYNQPLPHKSLEGNNYYITRRTNETSANPELFKPFTDNYVAFTDSTLIPNYGNIRGYDFDKDSSKIFFNSDSSGNPEMFRNAFNKRISIEQLGLPKKAYGGNLGNMSEGESIDRYSGQTHSGPQGGIPVGPSGSPVVMSGEKAVGLVEDGEVNWKDPESGQEYIFSNRLTI